MNRIECEKKIAELCTAIRLTMLEYNPDFTYLDLTIGRSTNGNDNGDWDTFYTRGFNDYWSVSKDFPIHFECWKDIKDEKYWKCVTEQDDRETDEQDGYEGNLLADGTHFRQEKLYMIERSVEECHT